MEHKARAQRFPIKLSLRYREGDTSSWHQGLTVNISRTGVLFQTDQDLLLHAPLEMQISFPEHSKAILACRGPVVRKQEAAFPNTKPAYAVLMEGPYLRRIETR